MARRRIAERIVALFEMVVWLAMSVLEGEKEG